MTVSKLKRRPWALVLIFLLLFSAVTSVFGETLKGSVDVKPWSGYWWPLSKGELVRGYNGHPSPIEKYDLYTHGNYPGDATSAANNLWYNPEVPDWYGICNGWANAAILEKYEFKPSAVHGVFLEVGDKKGLLAAIHAEDETLYEYCYHPEAFHRYLLKYVGEQGMAIAADLDLSEEFWSYPIYSYEMKIIHGENLDQVECRIKHANDLGFSPDFEGTVEVEKTYYYNLDKDAEGNYIKGGGTWEGESVTDHPAIVWVPVARRPERLFIDYDVAKEMALSSGDEYVGNQLRPGHHLLLVVPGQTRSFSVSPPADANITIKVALDSQSVFNNSSRIVLQKNDEIVVNHELDRKLFEFKIVGKTENDNYLVSLIPGEENTTGCSVQVYVDYEAPFQHWFYGFPQSRYWLGSAALLTTPGDVTIEIVGDQGLPFGDGLTKSTLANERLLTVLPTSATEDYYSNNRPQAVKICSTTPLNGLIFAGDFTRFWGSTQTLCSHDSELVIPWLTSSTNWSARSELYLAQHNEESNLLEFNYFKNDGSFVKQVEVTLPGNRVVKYDKGDYPDHVSLNGWALVKSSRKGLDGAILRSVGKITKDQLPLLSLARKWLVPHMAIGTGWQTKLSLYNPSAQIATVTLACHSEKAQTDDYVQTIQPFAHIEINLAGDLWGISETEVNGAWVSLSSETEFAGFISYEYASDAAASLPLLSMQSTASRNLPHLAHDIEWWTGVVLLNRSETAQDIKLTAYAEDGKMLEGIDLKLSPEQKYSDVVGALFTPATMASISSLQLDHGENVSAIAVYGTLIGGNRISAFCW